MTGARRPSISAAVKVSVAIRQANSLADQRTYNIKGIFCPLCQQVLLSNEPRILEHMVPRELGGSDEVENLRWVHKACAERKTNGNEATCADGDIHKIAKAKRIAAGGRKRKGPPMRSRGFQVHPTHKRTVSGKVVEK